MRINAWIRYPVVLFSACACLFLTRCNSDVNGPTGGTGKLRVELTDRPFPFDLIEKAIVTIVRVEVRKSNGDDCDAGCDDGQFCNGSESCLEDECRPGTAPCSAEQTCDEESDRCLTPCAADADCDDGAFCNGAEHCDDGACAAGGLPCPSGFFCDESAATCTESCTSDAQCDDGQFCNGAETCADGACVSGMPPACDEDEPCDEETDRCGSDERSVGPRGPWVVIFEGEREFNLLDLRNGRTDLLADADIPAGTYTQMRLIVTQGEITLKNGRMFPLRVPSGPQTGIKLHFTFTVEADAETTLLLDVDLSRAFRPIPAGRIEDASRVRGFHFSPSVRLSHFFGF